MSGSHHDATDPRELINHYDAVALTGGSEAGRDRPIPGPELDGIHFAMDFLVQQTRRVAPEQLGGAEPSLPTPSMW